MNIIFVALAGLLTFVLPACCANSSRSSDAPGVRVNAIDETRQIWFTAPAKSEKDGKIDFLESLPIGNGRLGAMDCGGVARERIILNESTVWAGGRYDPNKHEAYKSLPAIREALFAGNVAEAQKILEANFGWQPVGQKDKCWAADQFGCYQTLGDLILEFPGVKDGQAQDYRRSLDPMTGLIKTSYTLDGVRYTRELVASYPAQIIALHLSADKPGSLRFAASLARPERFTTTWKAGVLSISGQLACDLPRVEGLRYLDEVAFKLQGGKLSGDDKGMKISGADAVTIYISAGTDMDDKAGYAKLVRGRLEAARKLAFAGLRDAAMADHGSFMNRCTLTLPAGPGAHLPTPERKLAARKNEDPSLAGRLEDSGRVTPTPDTKLQRFEIAGVDGKFIPAKAVIDGSSVVVSSPEVSAPTVVRYAWATNPSGCNLCNEAGLPACPFSTGAAKSSDL